MRGGPLKTIQKSSQPAAGGNQIGAKFWEAVRVEPGRFTFGAPPNLPRLQTLKSTTYIWSALQGAAFSFGRNLNKQRHIFGCRQRGCCMIASSSRV